MKHLHILLVSIVLIGIINGCSGCESEEDKLLKDFLKDQAKKEKEIRKQMQTNPNEAFYNADEEMIKKKVEEDERKAKELEATLRKQKEAKNK